MLGLDAQLGAQERAHGGLKGHRKRTGASPDDKLRELDGTDLSELDNAVPN